MIPDRHIAQQRQGPDPGRGVEGGLRGRRVQDRAARLLGISQRTLIRKLKIYNSQDTSRIPIAMVG